jgi:threonylcarbamoyladenosine tRNA methylthiotransferase MtaB
MPLSYLHVFSFSGRPGTVAENLPGKVTHGEIEVRRKKLSSLSQDKNLEFIKMNTGQITNVLFERTRIEGFISGFTSNYIKTEHIWDPKLAGQVRKVKLLNLSPTGKMAVELID